MSGIVAFAPFGFEVPLPVIVLGAITGLSYGLLSVGLVLIYRANRVINFAQGQIGLFGAAVFLTAVQKWSFPYYAALPIGLIVAGTAGAVSEVAVVRRLRKAPLVMSVVATLGVGQFLLFFAAAINPQAGAGRVFPSPPGLPEVEIGPLLLTRAHFGMLILGPLVVVALTIFLKRSRFGLAMRSAAANPEAARMAAISVNRMSSLAWALAGVLSGLTAILVIPTVGFSAGAAFGPLLLLRALTGAVVARMYSLPIALATGVGVGILERLLLWNYPRAGFVEVALYAVIMVALLVQRRTGGRDEEKGSWAAVQGWRPLPEAVAQLRLVRMAPLVLGAVSLAAGIVVPLFLSNDTAVTLTTILCFSIFGISVAIVTGLGGQLSLGQFAIGGVGAVISYRLTDGGSSLIVAFLLAGMGAALVSLVIGIPALRIRGAMLTVTTLGFAVVCSAWLFDQSWMFGSGSVTPLRPVVGGSLDTGRSYYFFVLAILVLVMLMARNIRRGGLGRRLVAVRDNEDCARAFAISARGVKVQGFLLAGFIAGIGGSAFGHMLARVGGLSFPIDANIAVVAMTVIGGISLLGGPLIGAFYIVGLPAFVELDSAGLAATQLGWLIVILYLPGGLAQLLDPIRTRYVAWAARRAGIDLVAAEAVPPDAATRLARSPGGRGRVRPVLPPDTVLLEAHDLHRSFGGVKAVDGVSLRVSEGEILGLIGPNGAGKTTLFELLGGFTRVDSGRVMFEGEDVTKVGPEGRAERGMIRSFQDAALFPTLTVLDCARLAFERTARTRVVPSLLGLNRADRRKDALARELIGVMGLDAYRNKQIQELSTGTRRITEIACLIALRPTLLLLDEPSSGVAHRETEALGVLLRKLRDDLELTMIVIEHDIPLIMGLSDRIVAMETGRIIAQGSPEAVRADPLVVEAYLGGHVAAIERSGAASSERVSAATAPAPPVV